MNRKNRFHYIGLLIGVVSLTIALLAQAQGRKRGQVRGACPMPCPGC